MASSGNKDAIKSLHNELEDCKVRSVWDHMENDFVPEHCFEEVLTNAALKRCFPRDPALVDFVINKARRVFAILLCDGPHPRDMSLADALRQCRQYGLVDDMLPIVEARRACMSMQNQGSRATPAASKDRKELEIFHKWDVSARSKFFRAQWAYLAPVFEEGRFEYTLESKRILPIVKYGDGSGNGHFSEVKEVYLHESHYSRFSKRSSQQSGSRSVAIKEFKSIDQGRGDGITAEQAWNIEMQNLREISSKKHPHLVEQIAAVAIGQRYLIMSAWADGGDLRHFWRSMSRPHLDQDLILQFLVQIHGVADALKFLHRDGNERCSQSASADHRYGKGLLGVPAIQVPGDFDSLVEGSGNWRHGDLKPENLLVFDKEETPLGTLKIADLGLAKRHAVVTQQRREPTSTEYGTRQYEPPEAVTQRLQPRSRLYDVWSLGCIMLEYLIWLLYGQGGLDKFWPQPNGRSLEPIFFTVRGNAAEVSAPVKDIIKAMLNRLTPDEKQESALADVLRIIRDKLLVVELPDSPQLRSDKCRVTADALEKSLDRILSKAQSNEGMQYLTVQMPSGPAVTKLPSSTSSRAGSTLQIPSPDPVPIRTRSPVSQNKYLDVPKNRIDEPLDDVNWTYHIDNDFAAKYLETVTSRGAQKAQPAAKLCGNCTKLLRILSSANELNSPAHSRDTACELCTLIHGCISLTRLGAQPASLRLRRLQSRLLIEQENVTVGSLSIGRIPGEGMIAAEGEDVQLAPTHLTSLERHDYAEIIQSWLQDCDSLHVNCDRGTHPNAPAADMLPTRLLEIGEGSQSWIRLVNSVELQHLNAQDAQYAAFSYPWGDKSVHRHYMTTTDNLKDHEDKIELEVLPLLIQHAILVARNLHIKFLWIDSLCIIQGTGGDFDTEADRMETVFSSAYCVITASRASGVSDSLFEPRAPREVVHVPNSSLFLCHDIDEFQRDVIDGDLNKRGWVLQERALARRTIYFTNTQIYWECGEGIRCETLTKMSNKKAAFLGDPNFPQIAERNSKGGQIRLFQFLYEQYSRLAFTKVVDRPVAIAGLESRLCRAFKTDGGFGIFERYRGRSILWRRDPKVEQLTRISFPDDQDSIPSWSWMAFDGAITFLQPDFGSVSWCEENLRTPWADRVATSISQRSSARNWRKARLEVIAWEVYQNLISSHDKSMVVAWDEGQAPDHAIKCVIIAMTESEADTLHQKCYVLFIFRSHEALAYERAGVGCIPKNAIRFDHPQEKASLR